VKDGTWKQYYENGVTRLSGNYLNNELNGAYEVYFTNSKIMIRGTYSGNKSQGTWYYYDDAGNEIYSLEYVNGTPADLEKYDKLLQDTLKKYQITPEPELLQ
jgi:antitoxin component YwqK of YwqJK toxin-antitoxin module